MTAPVMRPAFKPLFWFEGLCFSFGWGGGEARHSYCCGNAQITGLYSVSPRPCQKHWYLQRFCPFVQHTGARMWNKTRCHKCTKPWPASAGSAGPDKGFVGGLRENAATRVQHWKPEKMHSRLQGFGPFCCMRCAVNTAFSQGFGNVKQQDRCTNARRITTVAVAMLSC